MRRRNRSGVAKEIDSVERDHDDEMECTVLALPGETGNAGCKTRNGSRVGNDALEA
jgi:hypothetical protein